VPAIDLWRKMLSMLFETGHPWITFKDPCNIRSPQQHVGVVHSSNLCTEITLNTSDDETAVCNLASINLAKHVKNERIDFEKLRKTVRTVMRMPDNVIDLNYYPSDRSERSNKRHRPVGLGQMGYTEALVACGIDWESQEHLDWADEVSEHIAFFAIEASKDLAIERGEYETFEGSDWSMGIMPFMTAKIECKPRLDWEWLAEEVMNYGMRNSNCMAIAPTATISIITGTTPCTEPIFEASRVEGNISGSFMVVDPCLRYGRPDLIKTVWQVAPKWIIEAAARRQVWMDQSQSVNIFIKAGTKGRDLDVIYKLAWERGLKTTYYLRGQSKTAKKDVINTAPKQEQSMEAEVNLCSLDSPDCESCQ
jgi:ribonucleoside-diphosphate reductase alpha chain